MSSQVAESRSERLRTRWLSASLRAGWPDVASWHVPEVDLLVESALHGQELTPVVAILAEHRASLGAGLDDTLRDLRALCELLVAEGTPPPDPYGVAQRAAVAWQRGALGTVGQACVDPLTGLATDGHLVRLLDEVYQRATATGERWDEVLVLVEWPPAGCSPNHLGARLTAAQVARKWFAAGQPVARLGGYAMAVLSPVTLVPSDLGPLRRDVETALGGCVPVRARTLPLPPTLTGAVDLVADSVQIRPPVACGRGHPAWLAPIAADPPG
jgi:hypothetical protein